MSARLTALLDGPSRTPLMPLPFASFVIHVQRLRTRILFNTTKMKFMTLNAPISLGTKNAGRCQTAHMVPRITAESQGTASSQVIEMASAKKANNGWRVRIFLSVTSRASVVEFKAVISNHPFSL